MEPHLTPKPSSCFYEATCVAIPVLPLRVCSRKLTWDCLAESLLTGIRLQKTCASNSLQLQGSFLPMLSRGS